MPSTRNHEKIKNWAARHKAKPAIVKGTTDLLRFEFEKVDGEKLVLEPIDWERFFEIFDQYQMELIYDDDRQNNSHEFIYPFAKPS